MLSSHYFSISYSSLWNVCFFLVYLCAIFQSQWVLFLFYFFCLYVLNFWKDSLLAVLKSQIQDPFSLAPGSNRSMSVRQILLNKLFLAPLLSFSTYVCISLLLTTEVATSLFSKTASDFEMKLCFDWSQWQTCSLNSTRARFRLCSVRWHHSSYSKHFFVLQIITIA